MPVDKWGIKFFYPTKATAGLTGKGNGFFWQQSKNAFDDDGMIRFGKEIGAVKIIDESNYEWMFPFTFAYSYSDGMSLSGPTGHHSGGETHGCQGFTYMIHGENFDSSNPQFRFRKETYHVQYDNDPQTGVWTHPSATGQVSGHWKGFGWVRYNRKDGRGPGKDSVICEAWWNNDPESDINNWVMLKRTEDKGEGISNWGIKATCDGANYQVGTWSNIQFRFKSSGADFSLHPLKKETNSLPNVNSIGGENMSFADCEARGYGYRNDMPRDIEMKCLFKWNGSGQGKCHFKYISIREIDPTQDFNQTPDDPSTTPDQPATTSRIKGNFVLMRDTNVELNSVCSPSGLTYYYNAISSTVEDKTLGDHAAADNITRVTERVGNNISIMVTKIPKQLDVNLKKVVATSFSGSISAKIWDSDGNVKYTSSTTFADADLTSSYVIKSFDFTSNTYTMQVGDRIGVEYTGTSSTNYPVVGIRRSDVVDSTNSFASQYSTVDGWDDLANKSYDMGFKIWR